jgi:hypothetical protein
MQLKSLGPARSTVSDLLTNKTRSPARTETNTFCKGRRCGRAITKPKASIQRNDNLFPSFVPFGSCLVTSLVHDQTNDNLNCTHIVLNYTICLNHYYISLVCMYLDIF